MGLNQFQGVEGSIPSTGTNFSCKWTFKVLFTASLIGVVFVFLVDLFDSTGTLVGVSHRAGLLKESGKLPRLKKALFADSTAIVAGAALGTSSTTPYIESSAGVAAGGRTGLTAVVVGCAVRCCACSWLHWRNRYQALLLHQHYYLSVY